MTAIHVPEVLFTPGFLALPVLLVLAAMIYWLRRVRAVGLKA